MSESSGPCARLWKQAGRRRILVRLPLTIVTRPAALSVPPLLRRCQASALGKGPLMSPTVRPLARCFVLLVLGACSLLASGRPVEADEPPLLGFSRSSRARHLEA